MGEAVSERRRRQVSLCRPLEKPLLQNAQGGGLEERLVLEDLEMSREAVLLV